LAWTLDGIAGRYEKVQKYDEARSIYQKIIKDYNETDYALTALKKLAILEITVVDDIAAMDALDTLISDFNEHPNLPEAIFVVGEQYYSKAIRYRLGENNAEREKGFTKALAIWQIIIDQPPSSITSQAYNFMAICHDRLNEYEVAIKYYQKVLDDWPDYKNACFTQFQIGRCYERQKNAGTLKRTEANNLIRTAYEAVVENYPDCSLVKAAQNWLDYNKKLVEGGQR
jgi:tetratricopeptide (TPR) repeat protein